MFLNQFQSNLTSSGTHLATIHQNFQLISSFGQNGRPGIVGGQTLLNVMITFFIQYCDPRRKDGGHNPEMNACLGPGAWNGRGGGLRDGCWEVGGGG